MIFVKLCWLQCFLKLKILYFFVFSVPTWIPFRLQVVIIQFGGMAFSTAGLTLEQWLWCLFFGAGTLVWGQLVTTVPTRKIPKKLS